MITNDIFKLIVNLSFAIQRQRL